MTTKDLPTGAQIATATKFGWDPRDLWPAGARADASPGEVHGDPIPYISGPEKPPLRDEHFNVRVELAGKTYAGDISALRANAGEDVEIRSAEGDRLGFVVELKLHDESGGTRLTGLVQLAPDGRAAVRRMLPGITWLVPVFEDGADKFVRLELTDAV